MKTIHIAFAATLVATLLAPTLVQAEKPNQRKRTDPPPRAKKTNTHAQDVAKATERLRQIDARLNSLQIDLAAKRSSTLKTLGNDWRNLGKVKIPETMWITSIRVEIQSAPLHESRPNSVGNPIVLHRKSVNLYNVPPEGCPPGTKKISLGRTENAGISYVIELGGSEETVEEFCRVLPENVLKHSNLDQMLRKLGGALNDVLEMQKQIQALEAEHKAVEDELRVLKSKNAKK